MLNIKDAYYSLCLKNNIDVSHGVAHVVQVLKHVDRAIAQTKHPISTNRITALRLAALLHDADDRKYFPNSKNYENARKIMQNAKVESSILEDTVDIIKLVSSSQNGDNIPERCIKEPELLWVRWADRLEAVGVNGVIRCWQYNVAKNRKVVSDTTPKAYSYKEVLQIATSDRFERYVKNKKSASMLDHYYDKLIYICTVKTGNKYFDNKLSCGHYPFMDICIKYSNEGEQAVIDHIESLL